MMSTPKMMSSNIMRKMKNIKKESNAYETTNKSQNTAFKTDSFCDSVNRTAKRGDVLTKVSDSSPIKPFDE